MAARTICKGILESAELSCPVARCKAASASDQIALHTPNRTTGIRVRRRFHEADTGAPVAPADQIKGHEVNLDAHIRLNPVEVGAEMSQSDKTLAVSALIGCGLIDAVHLDKLCCFTPTDKTADLPLVLIRERMRRIKVTAIAQTVLFRRVRSVQIDPHGGGLIATKLHSGDAVLSAESALSDRPAFEAKCRMPDLADHIIKTKIGKFVVSAFDDRYESALADRIKAKCEGKRMARRPEQRPDKVVDLLAALRESASVAGDESKAAASAKAAPGRKAS